MRAWIRLAADTVRERKTRSDGEQGQADHEDAPAAHQVAQAPRQQQQAAERDQVGVDDPRQARLREAQVALDRWQGHVHDRLVEDDHEHSRAQHHQRDPAAAVSACGSFLYSRPNGLRHLVSCR